MGRREERRGREQSRYHVIVFTVRLRVTDKNPNARGQSQSAEIWVDERDSLSKMSVSERERERRILLHHMVTYTYNQKSCFQGVLRYKMHYFDRR